MAGYARGRATKGEILDRALEAFAAAGFRGMSLRELAGRCGITHAGLLYHFPTKDALLMAALTHRDEVDAGLLRTSGSGVEQLAGLVDVVRHNESRRGVVELYAVLSAEATSPTHPAHAYFVARYERTVAHAVDAFAAAGRDGALAAGVDPAVAGRQLVALMDGLQIQWLLTGAPMVGAVRAHVQAQLTRPLP